MSVQTSTPPIVALLNQNRTVYFGMMKFQIFLKSMGTTFALLAILSVGCVSSSHQLRVESVDFRPRTTQPEKIILKTVGDAGQRFHGYVLVDGTRQQIAGVSPTEFPMEANILIGEFHKSGGSGTLSFSIENIPKTRSVSFGGLKRSGDTCRFGYHDGAVEAYTK